MESVLKRIYHGRLEIEENMPLSPEYEEARRAYIEAQNALMKELDGEKSRQCLRLMELRTALAGMEAETAYIEGMKMGARMTRELLADE